MRILFLSSSALALLVGEGSALAQQQGPASAPPTPAATASLDINRVASGGPNDRALGAAALPEIQLLASADDKVASLAWTFSTSPAGDGLSYSQFSLRLATSIQDKEGDNELLGLTGFPGGTELKLNFTQFFGHTRSPEGAALENENGIIEQAVSVCQNDPALNAARRAQVCNLDNPDSPGVSDLIWRYNRDRFDEFNRGRFAPVFPFVGVEIGANQDRFSYLDRAAFSLSKVSRFGYSGTLFGGAIFTHSLTSVTGSFTFSRRYNAHGPVTLCQTINATQQQCLTGPDGRPDVSRHTVIALELRHAFRARDDGPAAVAIVSE